MSEISESIQAKCLTFGDRVIKLNDYLLKEVSQKGEITTRRMREHIVLLVVNDFLIFNEIIVKAENRHRLPAFFIYPLPFYKNSISGGSVFFSIRLDRWNVIVPFRIITRSTFSGFVISSSMN